MSHVTPDASSTRVGDVAAGEPAALAGIREGDELRAMDGRPLQDFASIRTTLTALGREKPGVPVDVELVREGRPMTLQVTPRQAAGAWIIGIGPASRTEPGLALSEAVPQAGRNLWKASAQSFQVLGKLLTGGARVSDLSGPIGMISTTAERARKGMLDYLQTVWGLSVAIGFFNLLPIPALDGGRVVFLAWELVSRRRMNQRIEGLVHTVGLFALLALIAFVSYGDVVRRIKGG